MRKNTQKGSDTRYKGSISLYSLFIALVLLTVAVGFNWVIREHLKFGLTLHQKMQAIVDANTVFNLLLYSILPAIPHGRYLETKDGEELLGIKKILVNGTIYRLLPGAYNNTLIQNPVNFTLQDADGMLSLTDLDPDLLKRLLLELGSSEEEATTIVDSLLDWTDPDDLHRLHGAEKDWYRRIGLNILPRNYDLQYKEELLFLRGMNKQIFEGLKPYITLLPHGGYNLNTAKPKLIKALLDIRDNKTLNHLLNYLATEDIKSELDLIKLLGRVPPVITFINYSPSNNYELSLWVGEYRPLYRIRAGLSLHHSEFAPYQILYWSEN